MFATVSLSICWVALFYLQDTVLIEILAPRAINLFPRVASTDCLNDCECVRKCAVMGCRLVSASLSSFVLHRSLFLELFSSSSSLTFHSFSYLMLHLLFFASPQMSPPAFGVANYGCHNLCSVLHRFPLRAHSFKVQLTILSRLVPIHLDSLPFRTGSPCLIIWQCPYCSQWPNL